VSGVFFCPESDKPASTASDPTLELLSGRCGSENGMEYIGWPQAQKMEDSFADN